MIVFDASTVVGATLKRDSVPERALLHAEETDVFALSSAVNAEITDVLNRPKFASVIRPERIARMLSILRESAIWFTPAIRVTECRDPRDNIYLELALAAAADIIVSSDEDLLVLNPWRGTRILRAAEYLAAG